MNAFLCICRQHNVIFDHCMFDILGEAELPFQSEWNQLCFRQLLRICARVPCLEQRRHAGDLGVTHYCRIEGVGSTSHMSWMRNLMWRWSSLHRPGLSALIKSPVVSHHSRLLRFFYYIITPLHWWYLLGRDHSHGWILPRGSCYVLWLLYPEQLNLAFTSCLFSQILVLTTFRGAELAMYHFSDSPHLDLLLQGFKGSVVCLLSCCLGFWKAPAAADPPLQEIHC